MLKKIAYLLLITVLAFVPFLATNAQTHRFALLALGPNGQKSICVENNPSSVLEALQQNNFNPKQDETGFIYSLIGYDGPLSSNPAAQQAFWSFWISGGSNLTFSDKGPSQIAPENERLYVFSFGGGSQPTSSTTFSDICTDQPTPAPISENTVPTEAERSGIDQSVTYLATNYAQQAAANQDWGAMALGGMSRSVSVGSTTSDSILSLSRNTLGKAAQGFDRTTQVEKIKASYRDNQLGEPTLINDDIFGLLAISTTDSGWLTSHQGIFTTILNSQRPDGSFGFSASGSGDTDITAAAVWALVHKHEYPTDAITKAISYLRSSRNADGGHGFKPNTASNVASSAWVLLAYRAAGQAAAATESYLRNQRQSDGSYLQAGAPNYLNTAYAVMALSGKKMPIVKNISSPLPTQPLQPPIPRPAQPKVISPKKQKKELYQQTVTVITEEYMSSCSASASASASASGGSASASASASASCH